MHLRVSDLKQFHYCPRVVFYQYVLPVDRKVTYKMEKGKAAQEQIERLEARRKLRRFGLQEGHRAFNVWLSSRTLGLSGKLDLLIETEEELYPVDFKFTRGRPFKNHLFQLAGYALILEDQKKKPVNAAFVYLLPQEDAVVYAMSLELKNECLATMNEIRRMVLEEKFPDPPAQRNKCEDCEYQNYCRDIW
ncbi:MAG: CRISPR-associated protein Cas4 [Deltaproteobacteria bacterium]|nr:CRISPR-associated protein Cas4 [Deltaproteobacteria bacterium]